MTDDLEWMNRALVLAERGWGRVHPNPLVGAVIVRDGHVVGEGWHAEFGEAHAEVMALAEAGERSRGATLYCTLEPCDHTGKQPPCTNAIISAGIARVVYAVADPDPTAAGGAEKLAAAGIVISRGTGAAEATRQNFRFLHRFGAHTRPHVTIKLAVSMDGCIADARGHSRWLSSAAARDWVHHLRAGYDAIGVGAATAILDGSQLSARGSLQPRNQPRRVIFDRSGAMAPDHPLLASTDGGPLLVVLHPTAPTVQRARLEKAGATLVIAADLADGLQQLGAAGIDALLIEGGGRLAGALFRGGLVDRIHQVQNPVWLGGGVPAWNDLGEPSITTATRWSVVDARKFPGADDVLITMEP